MCYLKRAQRNSINILGNRNINIRKPTFKNKLEAWLAFLCMDEPEVVIRLIEEYPEFREMYEEAYQMCRNVNEVMQMLRRVYAKLEDIRETAQLTGYSVEEVEEAVKK